MGSYILIISADRLSVSTFSNFIFYDFFLFFNMALYGSEDSKHYFCHRLCSISSELYEKHTRIYSLLCFIYLTNIKSLVVFFLPIGLYGSVNFKPFLPLQSSSHPSQTLRD